MSDEGDPDFGRGGTCGKAFEVKFGELVAILTSAGRLVLQRVQFGYLTGLDDEHFGHSQTVVSPEPLIFVGVATAGFAGVAGRLELHKVQLGDFPEFASPQVAQVQFSELVVGKFLAIDFSSAADGVPDCISINSSDRILSSSSGISVIPPKKSD